MTNNWTNLDAAMRTLQRTPPAVTRGGQAMTTMLPPNATLRKMKMPNARSPQYKTERPTPQAVDLRPQGCPQGRVWVPTKRRKADRRENRDRDRTHTDALDELVVDIAQPDEHDEDDQRDANAQHANEQDDDDHGTQTHNTPMSNLRTSKASDREPRRDDQEAIGSDGPQRAQPTIQDRKGRRHKQWT